MQLSKPYRVVYKKRLLTYNPYAAQTFFMRALSGLRFQNWETQIFKDFLKKDVLTQ